MNRLCRVYSLTCQAAMQIYWNKRKCLYKKRVELGLVWVNDMSTLSLFCNINMAAKYCLVHALYILLWCVVCFLIFKIHYYFKPSNKRNEKS